MRSSHKNERGEILTVLVVLLGAFVLGVAVPKPAFLDSRSREADKSAESSQAVEVAVGKAVAAERTKGANAAAGIAQVGIAAGDLPPSPATDFVRREVPVVLSLLPPPDPVALLAAERRRIAMMEGKLDLADKLYTAKTEENAKILARAIKAEALVEAKFAERREVDNELAESAAYARGAEAVIGILLAVCLLCVGLWIYGRVTGVGVVDLARMANRAREGQGALDVIDSVVPDWLHDSIAQKAAKLRAREAARLAAANAAAKP